MTEKQITKVDIAKKVDDLVTGFRKEHNEPSFRLFSFPEGEYYTVNPIAQGFADYVVLQELSTKWGKDGFESRRVAINLPLFDCVTVRVAAPGHEGHTSWLYRYTSSGRHACVFDENDYPGDHTHCSEELMNLLFFFHELGHFVFHRNQLGSTHGTKIPLKNGSAHQQKRSDRRDEEVAWYFASCIMGHAVGDRAFNARTGPKKPYDACLLVYP